MTDTEILAIRLRADAALASAHARQAAGADNLLGVQGWNDCSAELIAMADHLEASASEPASTVTDAAIVAQARLVRELQKDRSLLEECAQEEQTLDAMLKASEVTA